MELDDLYVIQPDVRALLCSATPTHGRPVAEGFRYSSDTNSEWLTAEELRGDEARRRSRRWS